MKHRRKYDSPPPRQGRPIGPSPAVELANTMFKPGDTIPPPVELTPASPPLTVSESVSDWERAGLTAPAPAELIPSGLQTHVSESKSVVAQPLAPARSAPGFGRVTRLLRRLGRLPSVDWQLVEMVFFRRMSPEQVGRVFGMSVEEVTRRHRAILRRLAAPDGARPPGLPPTSPSAEFAREPNSIPPESTGGAA